MTGNVSGPGEMAQSSDGPAPQSEVASTSRHASAPGPGGNCLPAGFSSGNFAMGWGFLRGPLVLQG